MHVDGSTRGIDGTSYLRVRAGIRAIPARVYYLGVFMRLSIRSEATAEMGRKNGDKGCRGVRTRARAVALAGQGCMLRGHIVCGPNGRGSVRGSQPCVGRLACWTGKGS
jgi:hypothetical protein